MPRMTKATLNDAHPDTGDGTPTSAARNKRPPQVFDERGRTIPWMARTVHRLYNDQAQKILDEENITIAHWIYLRVLAERGELNQLELSKRVGMASTTAVPALDSMEKRGLLKKRRDPKDRRKYYGLAAWFLVHTALQFLGGYMEMKMASSAPPRS